jgi:hypothetical protein
MYTIFIEPFEKWCLITYTNRGGGRENNYKKQNNRFYELFKGK